MPTYEYICEKCGHQFETVQPISAKPLTVCPKDLCEQESWGKGKVRRAISGGAGLIFKGSGFYITDYRSEKYKEAAKKDSPTTSVADGKPAKGSEAKPGASKSENSAAKPPPGKP
jgi:putative FmdB family regulatory protein